MIEEAMQALWFLPLVAVMAGVLLLALAAREAWQGVAVVPPPLRGRWRLLTGFIIFFLVGYLIFLALLGTDRRMPLEFVVSTVFLGGALFVSMVMALSRRALLAEQESEQRLRVLNDTLKQQNETLAAEIAVRRKAQEQARERLDHLATLHSIDTLITSSLDLDDILATFLAQVLPRLEVDAAAVLLFNRHTQTLEYAAGRGFKTPAIEATRLKYGQGGPGLAVQERRRICIEDLRQETSFERRALVADDEGLVGYCAVPLIAKGAVTGVLEVYRREPLVDDKEWFEFLDAVALQAAIAIDNASLFRDLERSNAELILAYDATIEGWSRALELRDKETEGHTRRAAEMTVALGRKFGMSEEELAHVERGALLHDIGKMAVADEILLKEGPLTDEERRIMEQHPQHAYEMLAPIAYLRPALDIPYCHHEKWDGTGYPRGLKGEEIPLAARIFSVADIWDALQHKRRYHAAWSADKVCDHIRKRAGSHFDPEVVEAFLKMHWCEEARSADDKPCHSCV